MSESRVSPEAICAMKGKAKIAALTAYDYPTAKLLDEAGVPFIHVGDTVGMVVLGYPDTTHVTMAEMEHHVRAVARAKPRALIAADLPFASYDTIDSAVKNAKRLIECGADAVKAEGGKEILPQILAIIAEGIPYCGHIGMLPQHVLEEGGKYHIKGRDDAGRIKLMEDAVALAEAGAFAIVLEIVTPPVAAEITNRISVPTIGIGSGPDCDGQILVTPDLIGGFPWFTPRFVKPKLQTAAQMKVAVQEWMQEIGA